MRYTVDCADEQFWEQVHESDEFSDAVKKGEDMLKLGKQVTIWEGDLKVWENGEVVSHCAVCLSRFEEEFQGMFGKVVPNVQNSISPFHPDQVYVGLMTEARL